MENLKCRNCGSHFQDRRKKTKCLVCRDLRLIDLIPLQTKANVCELWVMGLQQKLIAQKVGLSTYIIKQIIGQYLGIGEQPILVKIDTITL